MLTESEREMFEKLLAFLGIELRYRGIRGGEPDKNDASCNGLYFYSKSGRFLYESTTDFSYREGWNMGGEKGAARFLLESCLGFHYLQDEDGTPIPNPFFGCHSLEEAMVKRDLLDASLERRGGVQ